MVQAQVKPCLDKLNSDTDIDVKYFAQEALTGKAKNISVTMYTYISNFALS
jgi:hypothetical protein